MKIIKSPLRYPGSKQKFCETLKNILDKNNIRTELFIEPFAGGASISLFMLQNDLTEKIALIEKDPLLASFWKVVFFDSDWLISEIKKLNINLETWQYFKNYSPRTIRKKALKCLFMNRTCFSGILKAGPIGGQNQSSQYTIDCRFNKENIINKIRILSTYKNRIEFIEEGDYEIILKEKILNLPDKTFFYFDPPYVNKAKGLYNFYFDNQDHYRLKDFIKVLDYNWLLSYDFEPSLNDLYKGFSKCGFFNTTYTTASNCRLNKQEFLATNLKLLI
jgi:DNA adenine methylase